MPKKCMFCGGNADLLCDGVICYIGERNDSGVLSRFSSAYTCDAPMCVSCSTFHGNLHWRKGRSGGCESIDYCPICESQEIGFGRHYIFDEIGQVQFIAKLTMPSSIQLKVIIYLLSVVEVKYVWIFNSRIAFSSKC